MCTELYWANVNQIPAEIVSFYDERYHIQCYIYLIYVSLENNRKLVSLRGGYMYICTLDLKKTIFFFVFWSYAIISGYFLTLQHLKFLDFIPKRRLISKTKFFKESKSLKKKLGLMWWIVRLSSKDSMVNDQVDLTEVQQVNKFL